MIRLISIFEQIKLVLGFFSTECLFCFLAIERHPFLSRINWKHLKQYGRLPYYDGPDSVFSYRPSKLKYKHTFQSLEVGANPLNITPEDVQKFQHVFRMPFEETID